jgi:hypothetical protein
MIRHLLAALAATATLVACSSTTDAPDVTSPKTSESPTAAASQTPPVDTVPTIPDGTYRRVATLEQWRAIVGGNPPEEWGGKPTLTIVLRVSGHNFTQLANYDNGPLTPGASATVRYDRPGHFVETETRRCCEVAGLSWTLEGNKLTLAPDDDWPTDHDHLWAKLMCCSGPYTKTG